MLAWRPWLSFAAQQFYLPNPSSPVEWRLMSACSGGAVKSMCWHVNKTAILLELDLAFTQLSVTISVFILTIIYA